MKPFGASLIVTALLACGQVHAVPIELSKATRETCEVCVQLDRDVFGLDAKRTFAQNRGLLLTADRRGPAEYASPHSSSLAFGSWRDLSIRLAQQYVIERPTRFFVPTRDYPTRPPSSVPEPGTIGLLLLGLGATVYFRRRARAAAW
jgi:hypothetical protein